MTFVNAKTEEGHFWPRHLTQEGKQPRLQLRSGIDSQEHSDEKLSMIPVAVL
jgi:hypothetical protein